MAAKWRWYACLEGEETEYGFESKSRDEALAEISREFGPFKSVSIVEAQLSTAAKYEGADFVPFIRERNHETTETHPTPKDQTNEPG